MKITYKESAFNVLMSENGLKVETHEFDWDEKSGKAIKSIMTTWEYNQMSKIHEKMFVDLLAGKITIDQAFRFR